MPPEYLVYAAVLNVRLADATLHLYTCDTRLAFLAWVNPRQDVFDLPNHLQQQRGIAWYARLLQAAAACGAAEDVSFAVARTSELHLY